MLGTGPEEPDRQTCRTGPEEPDWQGNRTGGTGPGETNRTGRTGLLSHATEPNRTEPWPSWIFLSFSRRIGLINLGNRFPDPGLHFDKWSALENLHIANCVTHFHSKKISLKSTTKMLDTFLQFKIAVLALGTAPTSWETLLQQKLKTWKFNPFIKSQRLTARSTARTFNQPSPRSKRPKRA